MLATYSSERLSMANKKDTLSAKQHLFATLVGSAGLTLTEAYSRAYSADNMKVANIRKEGSRLAAHPKISPLIKQYSAKREALAHSLALSQGLSDRDKVLTQLRHMMDHADPNDSNRIRATVELGRSCGVFQDTVEIKTERSSADIMTLLRDKLAEIAAPTTDDPVH